MSRQSQIEALRVNLDVEIKKLSRAYNSSDNYYGSNNSSYINGKIFKVEELYIGYVFRNHQENLNKLCSEKEIEEMKAEFVERAQLWYELRESRAGFTKDNLDRLIELEGEFHDGESFDKLCQANFEINRQPNRETSMEQIEQGEATTSLNKFIEEIGKLKKAEKSQGEGPLGDKSRSIGNGQERDR